MVVGKSGWLAIAGLSDDVLGRDVSGVELVSMPGLDLELELENEDPRHFLKF